MTRKRKIESLHELQKNLHREIHITLGNPNKIFNDPYNYIQLESFYTIFLFKALLASLTDNKTQQVNRETLQPFLDFLTKRWQRIYDTNAIYAQNPFSHANLLCIRLAELISPYVGIPPLKLLIPSLELQDGYDYNIDVRQIVMSDDNKTIIDVTKCLQQAAENHTTILMHTHALPGANKELSESEKERVINFNARSERYYKEISAQSNIAKVNRAERRMKNTLGFSYVKNNYRYTNRILHQELYPDFKVCTHHDLVSNLLVHPYEMWPLYLSNITPAQFEKLLLKGREVDEAAKDKSFYKINNQEHNRAMLVIFIHVYYLQRAAQDKYTSFWGRVTAYADDKEIKLNEALSVYRFLLSGQPLKECPDFSGTACGRGKLGNIVAEIPKVADDEYLKNKSTWMPWGLMMR